MLNQLLFESFSSLTAKNVLKQSNSIYARGEIDEAKVAGKAVGPKYQKCRTSVTALGTDPTFFSDQIF